MIERRNGTTRGKKLNNNLLNSPFQIDQRSFSDIMGYMSSYLKEINFYNLQNQMEGNWKALIEGDSIIYMVLIINEPLSELYQIAQDYDETRTVESDKLKVFNSLIDWYKKVNNWHQNLMNQGEVKLANKIKNVLTDVLEYEYNNLILFQQELSTLQRKENEKKSSTIGLLKSPVAPKKPDGVINLDRVIHTFQKVIIHIQEITKDYLEQNIYSENTHLPNNALYIAFVLLFKNIQDNINTLSKRHLDFYYKDILQQTNNKGKPAKAIVNFELLPTVNNSLIEKGTQLSAGKLFGSKKDVIFQTEKPLVVYQMELVELETLAFNSCPYVKVGTDDMLISSISKNKLISKGKDIDKYDDWFVFGANKQSVQNTQIDANKIASLGFIIGSPVLALTEGKRTIDLQINMETSTSKDIFWKLLNQIQSNRQVTMDTVFSDVFDESLKISYTTKKGWKSFSKYAIVYNEIENYFTIQLVLENADQALEKSIVIDEDILWPSIKVELNEYAPVFLYSFLRGVEINSIDIDVDVQRMRNLSLYNNIGKMPLGKSFDLFGPVPVVGSYLMVGKSELFQKQINSLQLDLEWESIPKDFGGFNTYFDGYPKVLGNDSYKIQLSALSSSFWLPTDLTTAPVTKLFSTHNCLTPEGYQSVQLDNSTSISLDQFKDMGTAQDFNLKDPLKYEVTSQSGFIKLTLITPTDGFGSDLYQKEYVEIATYNAKNETNIPYPNKPFVPKVSDVSVSYKASDSLVFNEELFATTSSGENTGEFFHITPFGIEEVITDQNVKEHTLMCDFEQQGYLFLGLKGGRNNTTISVYFHFLQSSTGININKEGLTWEYYQSNEWIKFKEGDIILDDTNGFIKSGIVEFILPKVEGVGEGGHQKLYWIRISTKDNAQHYPKIKGIYLNAVETICMDTDDLVIGKEVLEGSIKKLVGKFPDIKKVNQPAESLGGVEAVLEDQFYTNVAERLRHKSRAVAIWDYEHLILENFANVRVVKCTNFNKSFNPLPGKVKVIVLSSKWTNKERHYFDEDVLDEMKNFLKKHSSPFVNIQVVNPMVEYLLVNCIVEFMPEDNGGYYINKLNEDISEFLSPLSNIDNGVGGVGGTVVPNMVVSFLENMPYIKMIEKMTIEHIVRDGRNEYSLGVFKGGEEIKAATPWSIFSPVEKHHIVSVVNENQPHNILEVGIGNMEIGLDLILDKKAEVVVTTQPAIDTSIPVDKAELGSDAILIFKNKR
jgi:hypothetical protein